MSRQWGIVAGVIALILILIGIGWVARDRFAPVVPGSEAPDFAATDLDGQPVRFADLRGEVVLLNVWATWCPPCVEEMPSIQRLHERLGPEGLKIVAVSVDAPLGLFGADGKQGGDVEAFLDSFGLTFPTWLDPEGRIRRTYWTTGVPESFVIDRNGRIVTKHQGAEEWDSEANIDLFRRLLKS